jgi:hypothetical protein
MKMYRLDYRLTGDGIRVGVDVFSVVKETPCGYWIETWDGGRWVARKGKKRFACPTMDEAIDSFRARKHRHLAILRGTIQNIQAALVIDPKYYDVYNIRSSFQYPDSGDRKEFKDAVLTHVDTAELHDPYHNMPF